MCIPPIIFFYLLDKYNAAKRMLFLVPFLAAIICFCDYVFWRAIRSLINFDFNFHIETGLLNCKPFLPKESTDYINFKETWPE